MRKYLLITITFFICTSTFAQRLKKIRGDKDVVTSTATIDDFNAIEIDHGLEITIKQGERNSVTVTADKNLQDIIRFEVSNNILRVYTTQKITYSRKLNIDLEFVNLEKITLRNGAEIKSKGDLEGEKLEIISYDRTEFDLNTKATDVTVTTYDKSQGDLKVKSKNTIITLNDSAKLDANVIADNATVTIKKYSKLEISGDADNATFNLEDLAKLEARKMKVSKAVLFTSNKTDVEIYASKKLEINAKGKSNIYVYGNPDIDLKGLQNQSKIIKK